MEPRLNIENKKEDACFYAYQRLQASMHIFPTKISLDAKMPVYICICYILPKDWPRWHLFCKPSNVLFRLVSSLLVQLGWIKKYSVGMLDFSYRGGNTGLKKPAKRGILGIFELIHDTSEEKCCSGTEAGQFWYQNTLSPESCVTESFLMLLNGFKTIVLP